VIVYVDALNKMATVELDTEQHMENIKLTSTSKPESKRSKTKRLRVVSIVLQVITCKRENLNHRTGYIGR
jgi:hypothetical protein